MIKRITYLIGFLLIVTSCFSDEALTITGAISVSVKESGSGKAIEDANVSLSGGESVQSALTDSNGNLIFGEITSGMYVLDVEKLGYISETKNVIVNPEKTSTSSFSLQKKVPVAQPNFVDLTYEKQQEDITLTNKQNDQMSFTTSTSKDWITVSPSSGSISSSNSMIIKIKVDFTAITPGKYEETMIVNVGGASLTIPVNITYVDPPHITVTKPKIDEVYKMGDVMPIAWTSNLDGKAKIELLRQSSIVLNISNEVINKYGGTFNWTIPSMDSDYYKILISSIEDKNITFLSDPFKINLGETEPVVTTATGAEEIGVNFIKIKGNIVDIGVLATQVNDYGHVYSANSNMPTTADSKTSYGISKETKSFISNITELQSAKAYNIRAYATNNKGTSYGEVTEITTKAGAPIITTTDVTDITKDSAKSGGNITNDGGGTITERGLLYGTSEDLTINSPKIIDENPSTGSFTVNITGLTKGTKYYVKAYAKNSGGYGYGDLKFFNTIGDPPTVETTSVEKFSGTKAEIRGKVKSNGGEPLSSYGFAYGKSTSPTISDNKVQVGDTDVEGYTGELSNLTISTKYYVRAYAVNPRGTSYGDNLEFTTTNGLPGVTTVSSESINGTSAVINGKIDDNGGSPTTSYGFAYAETANPTIDGFKLEIGTDGTGDYNGKITSLKASTKYYVRAYATNVNGITYGNEISFNTTDGMPKVNTVGSRDISGTIATLTGTIVDDGGLTLTSYGFAYSESENPTIEGTSIEVGKTATGGYSGTITNLKGLTKYYYRAYASNKIGTTYGSQLSFNTFDGLPKATTIKVKDISVTTANAEGRIDSDGGETITAYGFVYSKEQNPTIAGNKTVVTEKTDDLFEGPISNLTRLTKYYIRAYVTNTAGTSYGNELTFTTIEGPYLTITSPTVNQKVTVGKDFNITWDTNKTEGDVTIEHWSGSTKTEISNNTPISDKTFTWSVPSDASEGADNFIKIIENSDTSKTYESPKFTLSNTTYVPDDEFEKKLIAAGWDDTLDDYVVTANISTLTTVGDALSGGNAIKDLTGIEAFVALQNLDLGQNEIASIDLSKNINLKKLDVADNKLTSIDLSKNTGLTHLTIESNAITSLDISKNTLLEELDGNFMKLNSLDVTNNTSLKKLSINGTDNDRSALSSIDLSKNLELTYLGLKSNSLTGLDLTKQSKDKLVNLDVRENPFNCIFVTQEQLDAYNAGNLSGWVKDSSQVFSTDCTRTYVPDDYFENELINLGYDDVLDDYVTTENIINVKNLDLKEKYISDITGLAGFSSLETLDLFKNQLSSNIVHDFSANNKLKSIRLDSTEITSFNVTGLTDLKILKSRYNPITTLDVSTNFSLEILEIPGSTLEELNLKNNTKLTTLITGKGYGNAVGDQNYYDTLDLSNNVNLTNWENDSYKSICIKLSQTQIDNPPSGWNPRYYGYTTNPATPKNKSIYSTECFEHLAGYNVSKKNGGLNANSPYENKTLNNPYQVFVKSNGDMYIADGNRVVKWPNGANKGIIVAGTGVSGSALDQLDSAHFVFVDSKDNIYVVDQLNHRIMKWEPGAKEGKKVAGVTGTYGTALNLLQYPQRVFVDSNNVMYILEGQPGNYHSRIVKYNYLATQGEVLFNSSDIQYQSWIGSFDISGNNLYYFIRDNSGSTTIYKYDLSTKENTKLWETPLGSSVYLSRSDISYLDGYLYWLGNIYGHPYKINLNSSELNYEPAFNLWNLSDLKNSQVYTYSFSITEDYYYLLSRSDPGKRVIRIKYPFVSKVPQNNN